MLVITIEYTEKTSSCLTFFTSFNLRTFLLIALFLGSIALTFHQAQQGNLLLNSGHSLIR